jgi:hypothetical protein
MWSSGTVGRGGEAGEGGKSSRCAWTAMNREPALGGGGGRCRGAGSLRERETTLRIGRRKLYPAKVVECSGLAANLEFGTFSPSKPPFEDPTHLIFWLTWTRSLLCSAEDVSFHIKKYEKKHPFHSP